MGSQALFGPSYHGEGEQSHAISLSLIKICSFTACRKKNEERRETLSLVFCLREATKSLGGLSALM